DSFTSVGPGVERMVEEVRELLPLAKIVVFSSDNMQDPEILKNTLQQIQKGKFDVLVGTQMLAKGHHFPLLTTVSIIDADSGLSGGDLRASERTFQLLHQVSGRAGRAQKKGHVYIQTRQMESSIIKALKKGDRESFIDAELDAREEADMPPFTRLVSLIVSGENQDYVQGYAKMMAMHAPTSDQYIIYGPAPAVLERLRGQYRYRFLVKASKSFNIQKLIQFWLDTIGNDNKVRIQVDVDPQSFY
ncbi:MAG: primosomal protein N', partial [Rickettsiales bacterium]|nr:primosomal protein N' [Rickettsiales bacterium]